MRYKKFSKEQVNEWYSDYKDGMSQKQIATKYKVAPESIKKYFEMYNLKVDWNSYHIKLSKEDLKNYSLARQYYIDGSSMKAAREKFNIPDSKAMGFKNYLSRTGLKIKTLSEIASFVEDHNFFSAIDNEIKAYLLGFFAADGHIEKRKDYDSYTLRINVKLEDAHILMLYNNHITNGRSAISITKRNYASLAITSKQIGEDLLKLGFDSNKTKSWSKLPNISEKLMPHFIRGFFDGDGSISVNPRKSGKRLSGLNRKATFTCYNKKILIQIAKLANITCNIRETKGRHNIIDGKKTYFEGCWILEIWKLEELKTLYDYLYSDSNYFYLRKKYKFDLSILEDKNFYASLQGNLY